MADWYPKRLPADERLPWYAEHFNLVEVNSTFYAVPSQDNVAKWCEQTPREFVFDVKLHRLLSRHSTEARFLPRGLRRLAGSGSGRVVLTPKLEAALTRAFLEAFSPMVQAGKLGALLLQLSPTFSPRTQTLDVLDHLLGLLRGHRVAIELRHREWFEGKQRQETMAYFRQRDVTLVGVDGPRGDHFMFVPAVDHVSSTKLAYLRAHGRNAHGFVSGRSVSARFDYDYSNDELEQIAERVRKLSHLAKSTHVVFNNNKSSYAPDAAERLWRILGAAGSAT